MAEAAVNSGTVNATVRCPAGVFRGVEEEGVRIFRGIAYALPPSGSNRWKPPRPVPSRSGVHDAMQFGPACPQPPRRRGSIYASKLAGMGEDCLSLNIWTPQGAEGASVFVWIHGGSLIWGGSSEPFYDGTELAKRGIVVVSFNYRLGIFGYLAHPGLSAESPDGMSGNYGLLDQIAALEWLQNNIRAFGGDPDNVTVAGESAGALSVLYLMCAPRARGLFSKAIAQSGYAISTPHLKQARCGEVPAEAAGERIARALGAADIADLRVMDSLRLATAAAEADFSPSGVVDGQLLPRQIVETFEHGEQAPVPLLAGFNSGEIRSLRFLAPAACENGESYEAAIRCRYGDLAADFLRLYPSADMQESILAATRDAIYGWTVEKLAAEQEELGAPVYLYLFDHAYPAATLAGLRGFHASEIPYVFGTLDRTPPRWPVIPATVAERALSRAMTDYWSAFAAAGEPAAVGLPEWRPHAEDGFWMRFADAPEASDTPYPGAYRLHEDVVQRRRAAGGVNWNWNVEIASPPLPAPVSL